MIVNAGFTAALDGKKLPSTTYRLSTSCALQWISSADVFRIGAETNRAVLMSHTRKRNSFSQVQIPREQAFMTFMSMNAALRLLAHRLFQLGGQTRVSFLIVWRVPQHDPAVAIESYAVVRVR